jgi:cell division protein FtsZ
MLEEDTFTLFSSVEEEKTENVFEFEVSREEQVLPEAEAVEKVTEITQEITTPPVVEEKKEDYVIYTKKSYESDTVRSFPQEELNKQLDDRKKILAGLSYRFGNKQNVNELENEPAYKRKGLELNGDQNFSTSSDVSRFSVSDNTLDRPEIKKNNSFLHDNVD